jgi:hypothetical protein
MKTVTNIDWKLAIYWSSVLNSVHVENCFTILTLVRYFLFLINEENKILDG